MTDLQSVPIRRRFYNHMFLREWRKNRLLSWKPKVWLDRAFFIFLIISNICIRFRTIGTKVIIIQLCHGPTHKISDSLMRIRAVCSSCGSLSTQVLETSGAAANMRSVLLWSRRIVISRCLQRHFESLRISKFGAVTCGISKKFQDNSFKDFLICTWTTSGKRETLSKETKLFWIENLERCLTFQNVTIKVLFAWHLSN